MIALIRKASGILGRTLIGLGNRLASIDIVQKPRKRLYVQINFEISKEYDQLKKHKGTYLERAFSIADNVLEGAPVDRFFYDDYYRLKSNIDRNNNYFVPSILSVATSITINLAMNFANNYSFLYVDILVATLIATGVIIAVFGVHRIFFSPTYNAVYPYILKAMEEKIDKDRKKQKVKRCFIKKIINCGR